MSDDYHTIRDNIIRLTRELDREKKKLFELCKTCDHAYKPEEFGRELIYTCSNCGKMRLSED